MDVVHEGPRLVVRLEPGEEVMGAVEELRNRYRIQNAFMSGIGAVDRAVLGHYDVESQEYTEEVYEGQFEVMNFSGNIGPDKIHAHITLGRDDFSAIGGHCNEARVSGTFELLLVMGDTPLTHRRDEKTGLDVFDL